MPTTLNDKAALSFELIATEIPARIKSQRLRDLLRYWQELAIGNIPSRADVDPAAIKPLLPYMMIADLTDEPLRIYYRLLGTEVVKVNGLEFTWHYLDELEFDEFDLASLTNAYRAVRDSRRPGVGVARYFERGLLLIETEFLICPLLSGAAQVTQCIAMEDYFLGRGINRSSIPRSRFRK